MLARQAWTVWEYIITFGDEVEVFWTRRVTATSLIFLLNRWALLVGTVLSLPSFTSSA